MEVINESSALLTNYEVYSLLTDIQNGHGHKKPNKHQQNLATITYEAVRYLENTPCKLQDSKVLKIFSEKIAPYKLTKAEKLQLLNHRPTTAVEIQLIVEESEERLTEEQIYELLEVISSFVPSIDPEASPVTGDDNIEKVDEEEEMEDDEDYDETEDVDAGDELIVEDRNDVKVGAEEEEDDE